MGNTPEECPECASDDIRVEEQPRGTVYTCRACGWHKADYPFYAEPWILTLIQALGPIDILQSLLTDDAIVDFIRPRLKGISHVSSAQAALPDDGFLEMEVKNANNVYLSQMLVLAVTYAELIIKDFYQCWFYVHPQRMNAFLAADRKGKASVDLNRLLAAMSKEQLIDKLVEDATAQALGRRIDEIVDGFVKDSKLELKRPLVQDLGQLVRKRNRIVHEADLGDITLKEVESAFGQVQYLLYILTQVAAKNKISVPDEYGLLHYIQPVE